MYGTENGEWRTKEEKCLHCFYWCLKNSVGAYDSLLDITSAHRIILWFWVWGWDIVFRPKRSYVGLWLNTCYSRKFSVKSWRVPLLMISSCRFIPCAHVLKSPELVHPKFRGSGSEVARIGTLSKELSSSFVNRSLTSVEIWHSETMVGCFASWSVYDGR